MDSPERYKSTLSFVDLLFNILLGFVFLFLIAFLLINPVAKNGDIIVPAEYIITLSWPEENDNDFDLWVKDPASNVVSFRQRESGIMHLDRDDFGLSNDSIIVDGKVTGIKINQESVTLRGTITGNYLISCHFYSQRNPGPIPVTVEVVKLNPYSVVYRQTIEFMRKGQQMNYYTFFIDAEGDYSDIRSTIETAVGLK
jgi:hypothetical protein